MHSLRDIFAQETSADRRLTDKNRGRRSHLGLYEIIFESYRDSASKVFEIGIKRGGSIKVWQKYFNDATIYALDIRKECLNRILNLNLKNIIAIKLDQGDPDQLETFARHGPFDIGIDDGSHVWRHQILTFKKLWPAIKPGGLYVIEDVLTSYRGPTRKDQVNVKSYLDMMKYSDTLISCMDYFKQLVDEINFGGLDAETLSPNKWTSYQTTIDWICFRNNAIFLRKRTSDFDDEQ